MFLQDGGEAVALGVSVASGALWTPCWEHLLNVHNEKYLYQPDHSDPLNSVPSAQTGGSFQSRAQSAHRQSLLVAETETTCISQKHREKRGLALHLWFTIITNYPRGLIIITL